MAIKIINREYCAFNDDYRIEYICDTEGDVANLPPSCVGSTAVLPSGKVYIVNASGNWVVFGG